MRLSDAVVTIVGMGLMGGSLGMALVRGRACKEVRALTRRSAAIDEIIKAKAADKAGTDPQQMLSDADIVVFASPVRTIQRQIRTLHPLMKPGAVVTDMGSVKRGIVDAMDCLPGGMFAVGGHPMCGKETAGLGAADPDLFQGKVWVLTPCAKSTESALQVVESVIAVAGAVPMIMDADRHDRTVACVSHLPHLIAALLVTVAEDVSDDLPEVWELAASGFRDTTRVAASNVVMMSDILSSNRENILDMLGHARRQIARISRLLEEEDESALIEMLSTIRHRRKGMFQSAAAVRKAASADAP